MARALTPLLALYLLCQLILLPFVSAERRAAAPSPPAAAADSTVPAPDTLALPPPRG